MTDLFTGYLTACALGTTFGVQGAVSPGPLQTLLISETLSHGARSSWRAAFVPPCTDPFALAIALVCVSALTDALVACVAFVGAALLLWIAWGEFRTTEKDFDFETKPRRSFWQIWRVNFLNPNLWIFSFAVNALQVQEFCKTYELGVAVAYLVCFFAAIVVCNLGIVFLVGYLKKLFNAKWLVFTNRLLSAFLVLVALRFIWLGLCRLGVESALGIA